MQWPQSSLGQQLIKAMELPSRFSATAQTAQNSCVKDWGVLKMLPMDSSLLKLSLPPSPAIVESLQVSRSDGGGQ